MSFSKSFPKTVKGSTYPQWEEIFLTEEEEKNIEAEQKKENTKLLKECIDDARKIMNDRGLKEYQTDMINLAVVLFEKRASHQVYWKENKCKEKFDKKK